VLVAEVLQQDPFAPHLFAFCNRRRDKLKILFWDHNGFWLLYRRLERGAFRWPRPEPGQRTGVITRRQLGWLLDGLEVEQRRAHPAVTARCVA
jgi:transposase